MKRTLIKQGADALTVTLPKEWTRERSLKAGDDVELDVNTDVLVLRANPSNRSAKTKIHLLPMGIHEYRYYLANAYRRGFDEIEITFENSEQFTAIKQVVEELLGFEITSQGTTNMIIKSVAVPDIKEYDVLLKRTFYIITIAFSYLLEDIKSGKYAVEKIIALQKDQLRLCDFCLRILQNNPKGERARNYVEYRAITLNDHCMSQMKYSYLSAQKLTKPGNVLINYIKRLQSFYSQITAAFFKEDEQALFTLIKIKYELYELKRKVISQVKPQELEIVQELSIMLRYITDLVGPISFLTFKEVKK